MDDSGHDLALPCVKVEQSPYAMPCVVIRDTTNQFEAVHKSEAVHRQIHPMATYGLSACVARPVTKREVEAEPAARKAADSEWKRLWDKHVWDHNVVREWSHASAEARRLNKTIHIGRIFGICVEKSSELPKGDPRRKFKYRVVFQGNNVVTQNWEAAMFQDLGSNPSSMQSGKAADCYGCLNERCTQQADAEQAYVQAELKGTETWVALPSEAWPKSWYNVDGSPKYERLVVKLLRALYGHPDAGAF